MHPMMAKRLELWRLRNFFVERLPSVEDVYLFRGVARDNPKDERLFAIAEVRDVTAVRDGSGRLVQMPHLERMLMEALTAIRRAAAAARPQASGCSGTACCSTSARRCAFSREELEVAGRGGWPPRPRGSACRRW